jgi:hypothetical protein
MTTWRPSADILAKLFRLGMIKQFRFDTAGTKSTLPAGTPGR